MISTTILARFRGTPLTPRIAVLKVSIALKTDRFVRPRPDIGGDISLEGLLMTVVNCLKKAICGGMGTSLAGILCRVAIALSAIAGASPATFAGQMAFTVSATDAISWVGSNSQPDGATAPLALTVPGGTTSFTVSDVTGSQTVSGFPSGAISLNGGSGHNDADGVSTGYSGPTISPNGSGYSFMGSDGSISGIEAPGAGYLVGLFVPSGGPTGTAPATLDFVTSGTSFTSLSPLLDQVFYIGDGLTGDGTGNVQTFNIPSGAGKLYLGISDASGFDGSPGAYGDNSGSFSGALGFASSVPEPSGAVLLAIGGIAVAAVAIRTRRHQGER
jgi:hypothetical protein